MLCNNNNDDDHNDIILCYISYYIILRCIILVHSIYYVVGRPRRLGALDLLLPVSVRKALLRIRRRVETSALKAPHLGLGLQFLLLGRMAKAHGKDVFFTGTGITTGV